MSFGKTVNLGNSIIGVSILSMPYCFVQSGLLLSVLLIILSGFLTRLSCHFLLKSAFYSKRRSFELMVYDVLGSVGRLLVEIGLIGFLLGTCVAYFIMIGDLAPKIISEMFDLKFDRQLRILTVSFLSLFVALPLSLLRRVDSLTSFSLLSMGLYACLILKLMFETTDKLKLEPIGAEKLDKISYWNISGLLTTFPIFSMAMSCQTSLFEIFDSSVINSDLDTIKRDNGIIRQAIYMCSFAYITVGLLGYMAFHEQMLCGNILLAFPPSLTTTLTKIGFIVTLLMSFPLCLFPCRTSVHSLTFGKFKRSVSFQPLPTSAAAAASLVVGMSDGLTDSFSGNKSNGFVNHTFKDHDDRHEKINTYSNNCDINDKNNNSGKLPFQSLADLGQENNNNNNCFSSTKGFISSSSNHHRLSASSTNHLKLTAINGRNVINDKSTSIKNNSNSYASLLDYDDDEHDDISTTSLMDNNNYNNQTHGQPHGAIGGQSTTRLYISDNQFKILTVILIIITVILSLIFPHIEFILGIIGSTAGTTVCFILPAFTFIKIGEYTKIELILARMLLFIGLAMLVFCTYSTLHGASLKSPTD